MLFLDARVLTAQKKWHALSVSTAHSNWFLTLCYTHNISLPGSAKAQKCEITACLPVGKLSQNPGPNEAHALSRHAWLPSVLCTQTRTQALWHVSSAPFMVLTLDLCPSWGYTGAWENSSQETEAAEQLQAVGHCHVHLGGGELQGRSPAAAWSYRPQQPGDREGRPWESASWVQISAVRTSGK